MTTRFPCITVFSLLLAAVSVRAELSVNSPGNNVYFHAEEGRTWTRFRQGVPSSHVLNPFGDERGDGAPAFATNPYTSAVEVAWGRAGSSPALVFASWDDDADEWNVRDVAPARDASAWSGRVVHLTHDDHGNRFVVLDDPQGGAIFLASAPPLSQHVNRPIRVNPSGMPGARPAILWDGTALIIAYERVDLPGGIGIVELVPETDEQGFIPNGGEGVPGIPEPVFGYHGHGIRTLAAATLPRGSAGRLGVTPAPVPGLAPPDWQEFLALVRIEEIPGDRLLVTWLDAGVIAFTVRDSTGLWSDVDTVPNDDPVDHEQGRDEVRRSLTGGRR